MKDAGNVTQLLQAAGEGHGSATDQLMPLVYDELRRLADSFFKQQRPNHTLQPTALVNEAYVKLVGSASIAWTGRAHFFAVAAKAMRQILINHFEARQTQKRGGDWQPVTLSGQVCDEGERSLDFLALDEAMSRLQQLDARQAGVVELRFFGGLSVEEAAHVLNVSTRTVELDWRMAKAWLQRELG